MENFGIMDLLKNPDHRTMTFTAISSAVGFLMTGLIFRSLELRLTEYGATYVTRAEARDIAIEVINTELPAAIRAHEKEMHWKPQQQ